jgi:aminopeptidase N
MLNLVSKLTCSVLKHSLSILLFVVAFIANGQYTRQSFLKDEHFDQIPETSAKYKSMVSENPNHALWDLKYNKLELKINPSEQYIQGQVEFQWQSLYDGLDQLDIDLSDALVVDSVLSPSGPLTFARANQTIRIALSEPIGKNHSHCFTGYYKGIPRKSGLGAFVSSAHTSGPIVHTLSQPWGAKEWWPCKQGLSDKIDSVDVIVHSPKEFRTASNGILISDSTHGDSPTCHWQHRHPIATYLVAIAVSNYSVYSENAVLSDGGIVPIENYVYPHSLEKAKSQTAVTASMIKYLSDLLIDYPYKNEKYGHAQFNWSGGMEHQTMSFMGVFDYDLIAHELAHQWFGNYIT